MIKLIKLLFETEDIKPDIMDKEITNPETGRQIKISTALSYDPSHKAYQIAQRYVKKMSPKKSSSPTPYFKKYAHLKLNSVPPANVDPSTIKENFKVDPDNNSPLQWEDPESGRTVKAYTQKFLEKNAKIKWKRIEKITQEQVDNVDNKCKSLLKSEDRNVQDSGAVISMICKTGLRPGSKNGFAETGNRGISTLGPDNVKIDGNKVTLNFVGKSYQENNAEFEDPELAKFLQKRINEKQGDKFLFDMKDSTLDKVFSKVSPKIEKLKDLRTYTATKLAKNLLESDEHPPMPLPEKQSDIKKQIKEKFKFIFEQVSKKLNNTPAMAKSSYVHPKVMKDWLIKIGVEPTIVDSLIPSLKLKTLYEEIEDVNELEKNMNQQDLEDCDEYPLPDWWTNEKIQFSKINK